MATIEEVYAQVIADEQAKAQFLEATKTPGGVEAFLKEHGCEEDPKELTRVVGKEHEGVVDALADEELESVSGGGCGDQGVQCPYCGNWGAYRTAYTGAERYYCPNCNTFYNVVYERG